MPVTIDKQVIEGLLDTGSYRIQPLVQATANSTLTLTVASVSYLLFTGTTAGQIVKLGNATTYQIGHTYVIHNSSSQSLVIQDSAGTALLTLLPTCRTTIILEVNGSAAGTWRYNKTSISSLGSFSAGQVAYGLADGSITGSTGLYWDEANNRLGIGTTTPEAQLHVVDDSGANIIFEQSNDNIGESAFFECRKSRGTTEAKTAVIADDKLGGWGGLGWTGTQYLLSTYMDFFAESTFTDSSTPSYWELYTCPVGSTTPLRRIRVTSSGRVFIDQDIQYSALVQTPESTATTASGTLTLTNSSNTVQILTGSATGYSVVLPSATTETVGQVYEIYNASTQNVTIKDNANTTIHTLIPGSSYKLTLQINGTAAGTWLEVVTGPLYPMGNWGFGYTGAASTGRWLLYAGVVTAATAGPNMAVICRIKGLAFSANASATCTATIYKNGSALTTISLSSQIRTTVTALNLPLAVGDFLGVQITSGSCTNPIVVINT